MNKLDSDKVLSIYKETASAYMLQIKEMLEVASGKCTYVTAEKIQELINDKNVENVCAICFD